MGLREVGRAFDRRLQRCTRLLPEVHTSIEVMPGEQERVTDLRIR
jgi:hypothetical protein